MLISNYTEVVLCYNFQVFSVSSFAAWYSATSRRKKASEPGSMKERC